MKANSTRLWSVIIGVMAIAMLASGCDGGAGDVEKAVPVRKKVELPPEQTTPTDTLAVAKAEPGDTETPPPAEDRPLPSAPEKASPETSVTKQIPDIPPGMDATEEGSAATGPPDATAPASESSRPEPVDTKKTVPVEKPETPAPAEAVPEPSDSTPEDATDTTGGLEELAGAGTEAATIDEKEPEEKTPERSEETDRSIDEETDTLAEPEEDDGVSEGVLASILGIAKRKEKKAEGYDPSDKVDPFEPLFKPEEEEEEPAEDESAEEATTAEKPKKKKRIPRTPLERMDLNQLKLVGIIRAESGNRALVEEASGKGYIISKGTYIGIHSGQVARILRDRVIVEEEYEDIRGEITTRERELKIEKPPGEGFHEM